MQQAPVFFPAISTETVPNVTGHHFLTFFTPSYFLLTNMRVATEEFFSVMYSCCCLTGLGLGLNILVLCPSLTLTYRPATVYFSIAAAAPGNVTA